MYAHKHGLMAVISAPTTIIKYDSPPSTFSARVERAR